MNKTAAEMIAEANERAKASLEKANAALDQAERDLRDMSRDARIEGLERLVRDLLPEPRFDRDQAAIVCDAISWLASRYLGMSKSDLDSVISEAIGVYEAIKSRLSDLPKFPGFDLK